jgi:hypothetical protein
MPRFTDVNKLKPATAKQAEDTIAAAMAAGPPLSTESVLTLLATAAATVKPGVDRWDVKTGQDKHLDAFNPFVVSATIAQLMLFPRPTDMLPPTHRLKAHTRVGPAETTVWRVKAKIVAIKEEGDGDFHLVLHDDRGGHMIGEIPKPDPAFIQNLSKTKNPWLTNIAAARATAESIMKKSPSAAVAAPLEGAAAPEFVMLPSGKKAPGNERTFSVTINPPVAVTLTGCGFFDDVHVPPQTGVSTANGIELHPVLKLVLG